MKTSPTSTSTSIFLTAHQSLHDIFSIFQNSYRHILVLSHNFLQHYDKAHLVMKMCTSAVSPHNPHRVVVLWEKGQGQSQGQDGDRGHDPCLNDRGDIHDDCNNEDRHRRDAKDKGQGQSEGHSKCQGHCVPEYLLSVVGEDQLVRLNDLDTDLCDEVKVKLRRLLCG